MYKVENTRYKPELTPLHAPLWAGHVALSSLDLKQLSITQQNLFAEAVFDGGSQDIKSLLIDDRRGGDTIGFGYIMINDVASATAENGYTNQFAAAENFFSRVIATTFAGLVSIDLKPSDFLYLDGFAAAQHEIRMRHADDDFQTNSVLYQVIDEPFRIDPKYGDSTFHALRDIYGDFEIDFAELRITDREDN